MAVRPIRRFGDRVLRIKAQPVRKIDRTVQTLIDDMIETMREADHGIGLAAPQVGVSQRLFVAELDDQVYVFVNPQIVSASPEMETANEACLSLPGYLGAVERHARVTVRGKDRRGKNQTIVAEGWLARCFQHEIDHLDGILYTDRMKPGVPLVRIEQRETAEAGA